MTFFYDNTKPDINVYLSTFRPGYGCQSTLLRITGDWKQALDENKYVAAILMDLSKAFDYLPHDLLLLKLKAYGVSENAVKTFKQLFNQSKTVCLTWNLQK